MQTFYQLFDSVSCTYTYILIDAVSKQAVIVDPVDTELPQYLALIAKEGLQLQYVLETHAHADHITSAGKLCLLTGAKAATPKHCNISPAEIQLEDQQILHFGDKQSITALHTPGHTAGSMSYYWDNKLFTGDTLLINGCGRTDFQSGSAAALYHSITEILFQLPDETKVYPGHDYHGHHVSTIGHEKKHNARISGKTFEAFICTMNALQLPKPERIEEAMPANLKLGLTERQVL